MLSRKFINIYGNLVRKYGKVTVKDFCKYEKLKYKNNKLKLKIDFLNNCKQLGVYPIFLVFKLLNVSNKDALSVCKRLLRSAIISVIKNFNIFEKDLVYPKTFYLNSFLLLTSISYNIYNIEEQ